MAFRGYESGGPEFLRDPLARFIELDEALEVGRALLEDRAPLRLAAVNLVLTPGDPAQLAADVRSINERFAAQLPWYWGSAKSLQMLFAAILLRHDDEPEALAEEAGRVSNQLRAMNMRWASTYEMIAVLAMRIHGRGAPIPDAQIERMRDIHRAMKKHHWWLTGAEDFPTCALLTTREGTPETLAARAHEIYEALREDANAYRGDHLQTASNMLALANVSTRDLSQRFAALVADFADAKLATSFPHYDEIAVLCFLPRSTSSIVATVAEYDQRIREHVKWFELGHVFTFAVNLAFVHIVGNDRELGALADVKALLDMQWIIQQRG